MIATANPFPELQKLLYCTRRAVGAAGEITVCKALEFVGYHVDNSHVPKHGDLAVFDAHGDKKTVEVKTARANTRGRFCFTLQKSDKYGGADHRQTDFVVLVCIQKSGNPVVFVIPTAVIRDNRSLELPRDPLGYAGKYSVYRQNIRTIALA